MPDDDVVSGVLSITGGAGGIGAAVARRFAATGGRVVVADIDEPAGQAVAAEIGGLFIRTDVTREEDNRAALEAAVAEFGGLDLVHLNAGTGGFGLENFQAGAPPAPVVFPAIHMPRTV
jgi:NAD(P)-dependent dehydrogenase (short-subunit alcohol dehydrogenase family)